MASADVSAAELQPVERPEVSGHRSVARCVSTLLKKCNASSAFWLDKRSCEKRYENKQSPEQKADSAIAAVPPAELVGVTIQPLLLVCHDWFLHWSSGVENECK